jgi:hypothetical protein
MYRLLIAPLAVFAVTALAPAAHADVVTYDAALASPGVYFGTGNTNSGFTVDTAGSIEVGLSATTRFVGPLTPVGDTYYVPLGDTTAPGQSGSAWGVDLSINLNLPGGSLTLNQITASLTVTDVTAGQTYGPTSILALLESNSPPNSSFCYGATADVGCANAATDTAIQNSLPGNLLTNFGDLSFNDNANDTYIVTLTVSDTSSHVLASDTIVVAAPEPGSLAIFGTALLGLLGFLYQGRRGAGGVAASAC